MTEPSDSLDPVNWLVWGDFLSDLGREAEGERARCIGRGLQKNPGGLYLQFPIPNTEEHNTSLCCDFLDDKEGDAAPDTKYSWTDKIPDGDTRGTAGPPLRISPVTKPRTFSNRPDLVPLFWDKLAELGKTS